MIEEQFMTAEMLGLHNELAEASAAYHAANAWVARLTLKILAKRARDEFHTADTMIFEWSDQGQFLAFREFLDAAGDVIEEGDPEDGKNWLDPMFFDEDSMAWNLDRTNFAEWGRFATDADGEALPRNIDPHRVFEFFVDVAKAAGR